MEKVRKLACFTRYIFYTMATLVFIALCGKWIFFNELGVEPSLQNPLGFFSFIRVNAWNDLSQVDINVGQKITGFILHASVVFLLLLVYKKMTELMRIFESGRLFCTEAIQKLYASAKYLLFYVTGTFLLEAPMSVLISMGNPVGERTLRLAISSDDVFILVLSLIIYLVAHIISEASKLQHEIDHTI